MILDFDISEVSQVLAMVVPVQLWNTVSLCYEPW